MGDSLDSRRDLIESHHCWDWPRSRCRFLCPIRSRSAGYFVVGRWTLPNRQGRDGGAEEPGDCGGLTHLCHGLVMSRVNRDTSQGCHQGRRAEDSHRDVVGQA